MFHYSMVADAPAELPASNASELLEKVKRGATWDVLSVFSVHSDFPRAYVSWHDGCGFVVQCFENEASGGYFLAESEPLSAPEIEMVLGGQAQERWPRELFVDTTVAVEAVDFFLQSGKQKTTLHWVRGDAFPREIVWEGRRGREAWEKTKRADSGHDV